MEILKSSNVMESFGLISVEKGLFKEIDELELTDVIGGSCGAGSIGVPRCLNCYQSVYNPGCTTCYTGCLLIPFMANKN